MRNAEYAALLADTASLVEITGGNAFKARAFTRVAREIERLTVEVEELITQGRLGEIEGVGASIAADLKAIQQTGSFPLYDDLRGQLPEQILELTQVQGLGPKKIKALYDDLQIGSLEELEAALAGDAISKLSGFGAKTQENLRRELARLRRQAGRVPLPRALDVALPLLERLRAVPQVSRAELAGSARRSRETVKDIDLVAASEDAEAVMAAFVAFEGVREVIARGPTKTSVFLPGDLQADLRVVPPEVFGAALHHFTGSKEHHVLLRARARNLGLRISEYGVFDTSDESAPPIAAATEEDVYRALGLPFIPVELREGHDEIDLALQNRLPRLIERADLRGDLHMHTTASDGAHSIEQMARAARALGHAYIAITDHSKSSVIANGLDEDRLRRHMDAIDEVDARIDGIRVLKGIEVDILRDGALDLPLDLLAQLDVVVGSVHASFRLDRATMTARVVQAIASGAIHILGHPTGRRLGGRDGYDLDLDAVAQACLKHRVALEINASAGRLDLNDAHARAVARAGVPLVISTDSHTTATLDRIDLGVAVARRAGLSAAQVWNTLPLEDLQRRCLSRT